MSEISLKQTELNINDLNKSLDFKNNFLTNCHKILGLDEFNKWFQNVEIHSFTSSEIIICAPSKLHRDWINREFFSKKSCFQSFKEFYPKLIKISAIFDKKNEVFLEKNNEFKAENSKNNLINLSKHDNVFAYGTELNSKFTFENFIESKHNKIAVSMAKIVSGFSKAMQLFDDKIPLFIHGNVGMGKTHLAQAIAWHIKNTQNHKKVVYLSAEKFMFHFVQSIRNNDVMLFKEKMRSIDVLIVDDVQFIAGKDSTQQEFMNCFNSLVEDNKQVVLVCDRCPSTIENIDEKLKSRITGGMIVNFKNSDLSDRIKFIKEKLLQMNFELSDEIINFVASNIKESNRDLEGALKKLYAEKIFEEVEINNLNIRNILQNYLKKSVANIITIEKIQKIVADFYNLKVTDLVSKNRCQKIAFARQVAMYFAKKNTNESLKNIGIKFQKDRKSVV